MSSSVSQINYWIPELSKDRNSNADQAGSGAAYLSYKVFLGLSVLGGFLALDHLYLRSPLTFLSKIIINIMFFGVWWLYDACQAVFNTDTVKVFGLGIPAWGPTGIGAGVLVKDVADKKHMAFFTYGIALMFGGLLGADSFLVGDKQSGFIRLISTLTIIFSFVSIFWWFYNLFYFFFDTKSVIDQYPEYFGAPSSGGVFSYFGRYLTNMFPFLKPFFGIFETIKNTISGIFGNTLGTVGEIASKSIDVVDKTRQSAEEVAKAATTAFSVAPWAASFPHEITPSSVKESLLQKGGVVEGESSSPLTYFFVATIGIIAVSGFVLTYLRSRKNAVPPLQDDAPPEPRVLRKSDQEKPTRSP